MQNNQINDSFMAKNSENKVLSVLQALYSLDDAPQCVMLALDEICQLYKFDRVRSYVRALESEHFLPLDEANLGEKPETHRFENSVDLNVSYFREDANVSVELIGNLMKEVFIYTKDFEEYYEKLVAIGYTKTKNKNISEICIRVASCGDGGMIGYFVLERFGEQKPLTKSEVIEIKYLFNALNDRIEVYEFQKQMEKTERKHGFDELTGLQVFKKFRADAQNILKNRENNYALLYLDVDKFKYINEIWGHDMGNTILLEISDLLKKFVGEKEACCRVTDDKFAVLFKCSGEKTLDERVSDLTERFAYMQANKFANKKITIIGGIYRIENDANFDLIIDKANIARKSSKGTFESTFVEYTKALENLSENEKELEKRMLSALENNEFVPFLQPKFDLQTNKICGAEALARWISTERIIPPSEFIPLFEKNGFIVSLDFIMYESVFKFIKECLSEGLTLYPISLNVSREHIKDEYFVLNFVSLMEEYGVSTSLIELEITENVFIEDKAILLNFLEALRDANITISIDDFGTAYSSLNLLKDIVVDTIKMDKSFIDSMRMQLDETAMTKDKIITKNITSMISELDFNIIFEGVETEEQVEFLKNIGCTHGQGFIFSKPIPLAEFKENFLKK